MLNYLFRANANNSGVYLSTVYDAEYKPICIKKSASTHRSILKLKREIKGAIWYSSVSKENLILSITDLPKYYSARFRFVPGLKANYRDGYWINRGYIEKALDKYCEIWSRLLTNKMIIHGDYSIDNLIFSDKGVTVIDWEHFSHSVIPKGFDALNLIYEQLYILMLKQKLDQKVISHANLMVRKIYDYDCLNSEYLKSPLKAAQGYISNNLEIWGEQVHKLPMMKFDSSQSIKLDSLIYIH